MKKLLVLALLGWLGYQGVDWVQRARAAAPVPLRLHDGPYVAVFGRDSCPLTQAMRKGLGREGIPFEYVWIDTPETADQLHARMERAGIDTRRYMLPVVDVSGTLIVSPDVGAVQSEYLNSLRRRARGAS